MKARESQISNASSDRKVGFEVELVLRDKSTGEILDSVIKLDRAYGKVRLLTDELGLNLSTEAGWESLPPRLEVKPVVPISDVKRLASIYREFVRALDELGYEPVIKGGEHSGSIHITLDIPRDREVSLSDFLINMRKFEKLIVGTTGNPSKRAWGSRRVARYPTIIPEPFLGTDVVYYDGEKYYRAEPSLSKPTDRLEIIHYIVRKLGPENADQLREIIKEEAVSMARLLRKLLEKVREWSR